jgi:hypothetical protein
MVAHMTDTDLAAAWDDLHRVNEALGWHVGLPAYFDRRDEWQLYAFDPTERPKVGHRSRAWTAVHPTQIGVIREMTRCLREFAAGQVPR